MNPLAIFGALREVARLVALANSLATGGGAHGARWSLVYTNRSFIAAALAAVLPILALVGLPLPIPADLLAGHVVTLASAALLVYAAIERVFGRTRAIWTRRQAKKALEEADALSRALAEAGAR